MLKIKIIKIMPYWLISLLLICAIQIGGAYLFTRVATKPAAVERQPKPQVLGASTSIRGDLPSQDANLITKVTEPDTLAIKAKSFLVFDLQSGQELMEKNTSQRFYIASLTKLMTGLVAYQNLDLNHDIIISGRDILKVKPNLDFAAGDSIKASDIFNSMLVGSCNDAALALANYVSNATGRNFVDLMNRQAQALGMQDSRFANPMGFDSAENYSTADDIKKLITATQALTVFKNLGRRTSYQFTSDSGNSYSTIATNTLIKSHDDIDAIKTGYTGEAGGAMATKMEIGGREIVVLVLNSSNREDDTLKLRQLLLKDFEWNQAAIIH